MQTAKSQAYYRNPRPEMLRYISSSAAKILEIGCGEGNFAAEIKKRQKTEIWGIELSPEAAGAAARILDKTIAGDIAQEMNRLPENFFDCIIFNDVLEHLTDPGEILTKIRTKLTKNGCLVCSIPNIRHYRALFQLVFKKDWIYREDGVLDRTHLRFFTKKSLARFFNELGFEIVRLEGQNPSKNLAYKLLNLLTLGLFIADCNFSTFACVVKPKILL